MTIIDPPGEPVGQAGHLAAGRGVVVDVAITLAVTDRLHQRGDGVAEVERDGLAGRRGGVLGGGEVAALDRVRLRGARQVDRGLRERIQALGKADEVDDLGGGRGLDHRLRVGEADVLGREDAEPPRDEERVGPALDQPGQPVEPGVGVAVAQRLDQGRDQVVMVLAGPVVGEPGAAEGLGDGLPVDPADAVLAGLGPQDGRLDRRERDAGVAAGDAGQLCMSASATSGRCEARPRSVSARARRRIVAISSSVSGWSVSTRARDSRAEFTSKEGFSVVAPMSDDRPVLDGRQEGVLLALVEPVDLVDEEDGPPPSPPRLPGLGDRLAKVLDPGQDGRERDEPRPGSPGDQGGQRRLARARDRPRGSSTAGCPAPRPGGERAAPRRRDAPARRTPSRSRGRIRSASGASAAGTGSSSGSSGPKRLGLDFDRAMGPSDQQAIGVDCTRTRVVGPFGS